LYNNYKNEKNQKGHADFEIAHVIPKPYTKCGSVCIYIPELLQTINVFFYIRCPVRVQVTITVHYSYHLIWKHGKTLSMDDWRALSAPQA